MSEMLFQRHELKYLIDENQRSALEAAFAGKMSPDPYGESTVCNVYYDTPDYRLIRTSLEKPVYKEKLRARSYGPAAPDSMTFLELKKKYSGVVYKRRIELPARQTEEYFSGTGCLPEGQISREIEYFRRFYGDLQPMLYLCYDRNGFFSEENRDLRVTFDRRICWRQEGLGLTSPAGGQELLSREQSLMEIKVLNAIPFWLVSLLSRYNIRQISFSKYGEAYKTILVRTEGNYMKGGVNHV